MAQRFGGKYSPSGSSQQDSRPDGRPTSSTRIATSAQIDPVGLRANLMFVPAAILVVFSLFGGAATLISGLIGAGLWTASAVLLREGLKGEAAYNARKVAKRPALQRKILAALLCGLGGAVGAFATAPDLVTSALYGLACTGLHLAAFGIDPMRDKGAEGIEDFQSARVARVVEEAEAYLAAMKDAVLRARDRKVELRVDQFQSVARDLCRTVEDDPRDLTAARKYLTVYLMGARDATVKFADIYARSQNAEARADYLSLLDDLEQNFAARTEALLLEDRGDLTVEIDVLRARLEREGVQMDRPS